jgi:uncharacterized membrane protein YccC
MARISRAVSSRSNLRFAQRGEAPALRRLASGFLQGWLSAIAAVMAWIPTEALGLREGFWAAITAIAVTQSELNAATSTARDQFTGAAIGGTVAALVSLLLGPGPASFGIAVVIAMGGCSLLNVASAARLAGITAVIIFLVPHQGSAIRMTLSRVGEVGWGVLMAITVVWLSGQVQTRWARRPGRRSSNPSCSHSPPTTEEAK